MQRPVPGEHFAEHEDGDIQACTDLRNQMILANMNGLGAAFVVDPLNGLDRREFLGLPAGWEASFANPDVRTAFTNFTLWIVREFEPHYLGLASEINTYMDNHPGDVASYVSLYKETYGAIKSEAPDTQVFVTFQWDDLNNMFAGANEGRAAYDTNWDQIEAFEPQLDLWVISSYPYVAFPNGEPIPAEYYTPLLTRTDKPLAVAEGGYSAQDIDGIHGSEGGQVDYLNAIHDQLGERLAFWVYLLLSDFDFDDYIRLMEQQGIDTEDISTLGFFAHVGLMTVEGEPRPALELWQSFRSSRD